MPKKLAALAAILAYCALLPASAQAADTYISPTGSDANPCLVTQPCRNMHRGRQVANPGDTVWMLTGSYGGQLVEADPNKPVGSADVTFRPYSGTVTVGQLDLGRTQFCPSVPMPAGANDVTFRDFSVSNVSTSGHSERDLTFINMTAGGVRFRGSINVTWSGGTISPTPLSQISTGDVGACSDPNRVAVAASQNITITQARFGPTQSEAQDCLNVGAVHGLLITRTTFQGCRGDNIIGSAVSNPNPALKDVTIENNRLFPATDAGEKAIRWGSGTNITVRHNTGHEADWAFEAIGTQGFSNFNVWANVMRENDTCDTGVSYKSNYMVSPSGTTKCDVLLDYASTTAPIDSTYHWLTTATRAQWDSGANPPYTARDYDGQSRANQCGDRGADEAFFGSWGEYCMTSG